MRTSSLLMKLILPIMASTFFLSSCGPEFVRMPQRFAKVDEVFPPDKPPILPPDIPSDSYKKMVFNAPYEDVYRAAEVSATQAILSIESSDKAKGVIKAELIKQITAGEWHYFFEIALKEIGPKSTEVIVTSKEQGSCNIRTQGYVCCLGIMTVGLALAMEPARNKKCEEISSVRWATGNTNVMQEMTNLMTFIRNNLLQAGVI